MRAWLQRFMSGRYGSDAFGNFLCVVSLICLVLGLFVGIFYYIGLALLIYTYFRMLSRNVSKRYAENQMFLARTKPIRDWWKLLNMKYRDRKTMKYFKCERCGHVMRVPKGKGTIKVTCPHCETVVIKHT